MVSHKTHKCVGDHPREAGTLRASGALGVILSRDAAEFPRIRKTNHTPPKYSVYDMIMLVFGSSLASASKEFDRLRERHGDGLANCQPIRFRDLTGRLNRNETPAASIEGVVEIVLLQ